MSIKTSTVNGVKVYNLSAGKSLQEWAEEKTSLRTLKKNEEFRKRIELLQDFEFPTSAQCIQQSADGNYIFATGIYAPMVKCFEISQLAMKFSRHLKHEVIKMKLLSEDYKKFVLMQTDRWIDFHAQFGAYYQFRIPKPGRDLFYNSNSCELYMAACSNEVYRFNLEIGRFMQPLETNAANINTCRENPVHQLFAFGGDHGIIECFDPRSRDRIGSLDVVKAISAVDSSISIGTEVSCLEFDTDGLTMVAGTSEGAVAIFDLRVSRPLLIKEHQYGYPINNLHFHSHPASHMKYVMSSDKQILKIWERNTGNSFTSIEPVGNINELSVCPESGLLLMACETQKVQSFYIPSLGPAPSWCAFLDSITEELEEESKASVYENYKFITREELELLGLTPLIGTDLLRAHMHGYFMDMKLYRKAKAITEPYESKKLMESALKSNKAAAAQKTEGKSEKKDKEVKVNEDLAERDNIVQDPRFKSLFTNPDFQRNKERRKHTAADQDTGDQAAEEEEDESLGQYSRVDLGDSNEDKKNKKNKNKNDANKKNNNTNNNNNDRRKRKQIEAHDVAMFELKEGQKITFQAQQQKQMALNAKLGDVTLESRIKRAREEREEDGIVDDADNQSANRVSGAKEMSFYLDGEEEQKTKAELRKEKKEQKRAQLEKEGKIGRPARRSAAGVLPREKKSKPFRSNRK